MSTDTRYGYYSREAAREHGYAIWRTPEGTEVSVTCVDPSPDGVGTFYKWKDAVFVGEIGTLLRTYEGRWPKPGLLDVHRPASLLRTRAAARTGLLLAERERERETPIGILCDETQEFSDKVGSRLRGHLNLLAAAFPEGSYPRKELDFLPLENLILQPQHKTMAPLPKAKAKPRRKWK